MFFYSSLTIENHLISPLKELRKSIWTIAPTQETSFDRTWLLATPWNRRGEKRYSSYSFMTSALDGGEWSASCPGRALPPGKGPPVSIGQEAGWAPEPVWTQRLDEKSFAPAGDRTWIDRYFQSVVRLRLISKSDFRNSELLTGKQSYRAWSSLII
jgi:hypothetical protein